MKVSLDWLREHVDNDQPGHRGVARELACLLDQTLKPLKTDYSEVDKDSTGKGLSEITSIEVDDDDRCGRYTARVALDVDVSERHQWLRKPLESIGLRSINLVVDLTNYVLMDLGQPLHAFDLDRLDGEELIIRRARYGEDFAAMDGTHHTLDTEDLVIADASRAVVYG